MALLILSVIFIALTPLFVSSYENIFLAGQKSTALYKSQGIIDGQIVTYVYGSSDTLNLTFPNGTHEIWGRKLDVSLLTTFLPEPLARIRYVAVGNAKTILTSPDGESWTDNTPADFSYDLRGVVWGGSSPKKFVAVGTFGTILLSDDGELWTRVHDSGYTLNGVVWASTEGQRMFMAVGENGTVVTSTDGYAWDTQYVGTENLNSVAFAETDLLGTAYFVVVGHNGTILTSEDSVNWILYQNSAWGNLRSVAWSGDMFIAVGDSGTILTSVDAENWTEHGGVGSPLQSVAWGRGIIIAAGADGKIFDLTDPYAPIERYSDGSELKGVTWSYNKYVAVGSSGTSGRILASDDGVFWEIQTVPAGYELFGVAGR